MVTRTAPITRVGLALAAAMTLAAPPASAANRAFWRFETARDFLRGESDGVTIGPEGQVRLAPAIRTLHEGERPFVWAVAPDGGAGVLAASGAPAALVRIGGGRSEPLAELDQVGVQAVARGADGSIFFATTPGGGVQQILPGGERRVFHTAEARYIWALSVEPGGSVLVATGMPATLIRVQPSGEAETIFSTREENITALLVSDDGVIHVGTEPSGIVFRIDRDTGAMALFDSPQAEIRALARNAAGEVFAAAVASSGPDRAALTGAPATPPAAAAGGATATVSVSTATSFQVAQTAAAASRSPGAGGEGTHALYRITPDGASEAIWESSLDRPLALAMLRDERLLLGTGDRGRVYRITRDGDVTLLLRIESEQITAAFNDGTTTLLGASNPGRVLSLAAEPRTEGRYRSRALDAGGAARFGRISWESRSPPGAAVVVETRSGNSSEPDDTWSEWVAAEADAPVRSPPARFLEWRAILRSDGRASPELESVEVAYLPTNLAPRVTAITLHPPGTAFEQMIQPSAPRLMGMEHLPTTTEAARQSASASAMASVTGRQLYRHGVRTATFEAGDPNGDRLRYRISYREVGEVNWRELRTDLREKIVAWDTATIPDGRYELRVEAVDSPDNPPGEALSGSRTSRPFTIDNTPPTIGGLTPTADGTLTFHVEDGGSPIRRVSVSVGGGPPRVVRPVDGIPDSFREEYAFRPASPAAGGAALVIRAEDDAGNWTAVEASPPP